MHHFVGQRRDAAELPDAILLHLRHLQEARFVGVLAGEEVREVLHATVHLRAIYLPAARTHRRRPRILQRIPRNEAVLPAHARGDLSQRALVNRAGREVGAVPPVPWREVIGGARGALLTPEAPARPARRALFRSDDDHAIRGIGAVQGRRRRALHDVDRLDLIHADVGKTSGTELPERAAGVRYAERRVLPG